MALINEGPLREQLNDLAQMHAQNMVAFYDRREKRIFLDIDPEEMDWEEKEGDIDRSKKQVAAMEGDSERYLPLFPPDSRSGYRIMQTFVEELPEGE